MPKDGKDKSKDKSASKPVASQDGDSDIEEEQIKVRGLRLYTSFAGLPQRNINQMLPYIT